MLDVARRRVDPLDDLEPVADAHEVAKLIEVVRDGPRLRRGQAVRGRPRQRHPRVARPAPRAPPAATLQLLRAARAVAALDGRDYVLPDDLQALAVPVLAHRISRPPRPRSAAAPPSGSWPTSCRRGAGARRPRAGGTPARRAAATRRRWMREALCGG